MLLSVLAAPPPAQEGDDGEGHDGEARKKEAPKPPGERLAGAARALLAETLGTFLLTLVAAGGIVIGEVSGGQVGEAARTVAPGLLVMGLIYAIGDASGAHFNPAVTLAFTLRGDFPWRRLPLYWATQILGACLAAALLRGLFGHAGHLGATRPHYGGAPTAFVMEAVLSTLLLLVILGTATRYSLVGPNAALAVGGTIALCGLFADPISGASMNPARSLGPMLVGGETANAWVYVAGPLLGAATATVLMALLHGQKDPKEGEAAEGKGEKG